MNHREVKDEDECFKSVKKIKFFCHDNRSI